MYEPEGTPLTFRQVFSFLNKYSFPEIETEKIKEKSRKYCEASQNNFVYESKKTLFTAHFHNNDKKIKLKWFDKLLLEPIAFGERFALLSHFQQIERLV